MTDLEPCLASLPKKLKIGAYDWSVIISEDENKTNTIAQAQFRDYTLTIWKNNLQSPGLIVGVILHECLHVIYDYHGLNKVRKNREESIILGFETGLVSLFRDNPKLIVWMRKWLR